jgi:hypothetical protein
LWRRRRRGKLRHQGGGIWGRVMARYGQRATDHRDVFLIFLVLVLLQLRH